ncbi:Coenzyme F420 hydrogenase/dehydrogenase, beta subunit C-terminal domain [Rhodobacteraceae bacterium NNCM2]|nr:Coenzyme F420 hydrogenase/dehydrogenase, beta subunit C-terminal domain [Coraliihabitans acroporae]
MTSSATMAKQFQASRTLSRVAAGDLCAGCGGCSVAAPGKVSMVESEAGFLRPRQSAGLTATEEATVADICPGLSLKQESNGRTDHEIWGPVIKVRSGFATDKVVRETASSGGALSALLIHLLAHGEVEYILHTGPSPELPFGNAAVESRSLEEIVAASGSRYAPSAPLAGLDAALAEGRKAAFVGKPCDVAALRALARHDPRVDRVFPWIISFFCAGVPSHFGAREILGKLGVAEGDLAAFRYRGMGWPGRATATRRDGSQESMSYADSWGGILSRHVQFRCKICPDGTGGFADVVCADAWKCDSRGYPLFEEADGISLIVSRTDKGEELVQQAMAAGDLEADPFDIAGIAAIQPGQLNRKRVALARISAMAILLRPVPKFSGFNLLTAAKGARIPVLLRNFLGTGRRLVLASWPFRARRSSTS